MCVFTSQTTITQQVLRCSIKLCKGGCQPQVRKALPPPPSVKWYKLNWLSVSYSYTMEHNIELVPWTHMWRLILLSQVIETSAATALLRISVKIAVCSQLSAALEHPMKLFAQSIWYTEDELVYNGAHVCVICRRRRRRRRCATWLIFQAILFECDSLTNNFVG